MKSLIIANWKMNPQNLAEAERIFTAVKKGVKNIKNIEIVICPPFIYLADLMASAFAKGFGGLAFGSQDCFWEQKGAFTGEVSPSMLKDLGCQYVIVGHSERRKYFGETDEIINKKIKTALKARLTPILCIGEAEKERKEGKTLKVLKTQLKKSLNHLITQSLNHLIIAYEPVWAIGTGKPCGTNEAINVALFIRKTIRQNFGRSLSEKVRLLYGGSVNSKNAERYIKEADFDGLLVGGVSLNPREFIKIVKNVK